MLHCTHQTLNIYFFFFNDTATTEIYTLSLHDALPISRATARRISLVTRHHPRRTRPTSNRLTAPPSEKNGSRPSRKTAVSGSGATPWRPFWRTGLASLTPSTMKTPASLTGKWSWYGSRSSPRFAGSAIVAGTRCCEPKTRKRSRSDNSSTSRLPARKPACGAFSGLIQLTDPLVSAARMSPAQGFTQARQDQHLAITNSTRPRLADNRLDDRRGMLFLDEDGQLDLGKEGRVVLTSQVLTQPVLLPPVSHRFADRSPENLHGLKRGEDRLGAERLHEGDDLDRPPRSRRPLPGSRTALGLAFPGIRHGSARSPRPVSTGAAGHLILR